MGPLAGVRVIELPGIGPCPMSGMLLAELGATVLRIERPGPKGGIGLPAHSTLVHRSRPSLGIDLKQDPGVNLVLRLCERADALIEGMRPGVTERLGIGPEDCHRRNPRLIYGRVTGWGQTGPLAGAAGHDLNYIALTGALHAIGRRGQAPTPPLNLVGDYGGGALYLALGVLAALIEARHSGQGQVVDAAMVDGAASLMTAAYALFDAGLNRDQRGVNILDSGAHFYDVYETSDAKYVALAPIEPQFYAELLRCLDLTADTLPHSLEPQEWPALKAKLGALIKTRTRDEWVNLLEGTDACAAPVLSMEEAPHHRHIQARETFVRRDGTWQPNAAPRFSRTTTAIRSSPGAAGRPPRETLTDWGLETVEIDGLLANGVVLDPISDNTRR